MKDVWNIVDWIFKENQLNESQYVWIATVGILLCIAIPYLLGSINPAVLISKTVYHDDIRRHGSGNAGSTNMLRTYGKGAAAATFAAYFLEFVIRDVNSKRYLAFNTHRLSVLLASLLLVLNALVVSLETMYWLPVSILLTALMLLLEGREILAIVKGLLQVLTRRRSKNVYK